MFKNYFKTAWRNLFRNKLYTVINIAGLSFGITCFVLIGLYLFDELTFDQQHSNANRIYRVISHKTVKGEDLVLPMASYKLAEESKKLIPEIENTTRFTINWTDYISNPENQNRFYETIYMCDQNFLKVFDFPLVDGDRNTALQEPNSVIITEDLALKMFQSTKVAGKTIRIDFAENPLKVTAVLKNTSPNSSIQFNAVISESTVSAMAWYKEAVADWSANDFTVFALLQENAAYEAVSSKITQLSKANYKPEPGTKIGYSLQPLTDMHFYSENLSDSPFTKGNLTYVYVFMIIAFFVLLIACINYTNLTTARAANRSKEIGVRKCIGAFSNNLIKQFLLESFIVTFISFVLSIGLVNLLLPVFNQFANKQLSLGFGTDYRIWTLLISFLIITGLLSGSYPAFILSRFRPVLLLKGLKINDGNNLSFRKGLVVFQFTISTVMIIATMVIILQVRFIRNKDLGFDKEHLVVVDINSEKVRNSAETIKIAFENISGIQKVSISSRVPGEWKSIPTVKIKREGNSDEFNIAYFIGADKDFVKTFGVQLLHGRNFNNASDSSAVIINETAAKKLNIKEAEGQWVEMPAMALGGSYFPVNRTTNLPFKAKIIGIVKDFNFQSLREKMAPIVLGFQKNPVQSIDYITSRIEVKEVASTLKRMKAILAKIDGSHLFEYHFLDEQLELFYTEDKRRGTLLIWIALATIFIACLGLFGLATYSAEQRVKEIGVRKVLGASIINVVSLLSKEFLKLVLIANVIAFPVAWWAANRWLREFAYHIDVKWWLFGLAGVSAIVIAIFTVSFQAIKAAMANPVKSLRTE
jgi:putative ABC transport system permease protein